MDDEGASPAPRGTTRRNVLRTAAWTFPVVSAVSAAPAFASSTTVTMTPSRTGILFPRLVITFTNGAAGYTADITSITYDDRLVGVPAGSGSLDVSSATNINSLGGSWTGVPGSAVNVPVVRTYVITYTFAGVGHSVSFSV